MPQRLPLLLSDPNRQREMHSLQHIKVRNRRRVALPSRRSGGAGDEESGTGFGRGLDCDGPREDIGLKGELGECWGVSSGLGKRVRWDRAASTAVEDSGRRWRRKDVVRDRCGAEATRGE